jgi:hypothetical protein
MFQHKCKICRSGKADEIEFCRFYLRWEYSTIIDSFCEDIDNLNSYNLSNHLNHHVDREKTKFLQNLRESIGIYEPSVEEAQLIIEKIMKSIDANYA